MYKVYISLTIISKIVCFAVPLSIYFVFMCTPQICVNTVTTELLKTYRLPEILWMNE